MDHRRGHYAIQTLAWVGQGGTLGVCVAHLYVVFGRHQHSVFGPPGGVLAFLLCPAGSYGRRRHVGPNVADGADMVLLLALCRDGLVAQAKSKKDGAWCVLRLSGLAPAWQ